MTLTKPKVEGNASPIRPMDVEEANVHRVLTDEGWARRNWEMRLVLLGAALVAGCVLYVVLPEIAYFIAVTLALIALVAISFAVDTQQSSWLIGGAVALMHIAWIAFALQFTGHLNSPLLPLLYLVVVVYAICASSTQTGLVVGGAVVALCAQALVMETANSEVLLTLGAHSILLIAISWMVSKYMTQLYQAHSTARHKARRYWAMTESSDDALLLVDPGWWVQEANATAVRMLGNGDGPQLEGKNLVELLQLRHSEGLRPYQDQILAGESVAEVPLTTTSTNGRPHKLLFSALPITEDSQITSINVAIRDITELSQTQQELKHLEKFAAVRHVLTSLGHTLNNPLAIIRMSIQVAQTIGEEPDWDEIIRQLDRCDAAIRGLEVYAAGRDTEIPAVDVQEVIEQALLLTRAQLMISGVELEQDIHPNLPLAHANRHSLYHSFVNIVTYAWQSMEDWPGPRKLRIEAHRRFDGVEIKFRMTGPSPGPGEVPELLKGPETPAESQNKFTDVGLPVVYTTVQQAGGQVLVSPNRQETGTFVKIILRAASEEEVKRYKSSRGSVNE